MSKRTLLRAIWVSLMVLTTLGVGHAAPPSQTDTGEAAPFVVQTSPTLGVEHPVDQPIEILFDQPMDKASVQAAFSISPLSRGEGDTETEPEASLDGVFSWPDDQTLWFQLKAGEFERDTTYRVSLDETAESVSGQPLVGPLTFRFSTAGFLEVTSVFPTDGSTEILPDTVVTVAFNRPVVPLVAVEELDTLPDPLTFTPAVRGAGEWLNTSIYQFVAEDGFLPATTYTARVSEGLQDALGATVLEDDIEWEFTTVAPAVVAVIPRDGAQFISPGAAISVTFNQPMDRASVAENFSFTLNDEPIAGSFTWLDEPLVQEQPQEPDGYYEYEYSEGDGPAEVGVETVVFTPRRLLRLGETYLLNLPAGTAGAISPSAATLRDFSAEFTVIPRPRISYTDPDAGEVGVAPWRSFEVGFNSPMQPDSLVFGENLLIEPTVAATQVYTYWSRNNRNVSINFPIDPNTAYTVTIGSGMLGRFGAPLRGTETITWQTAAYSPHIHLHSPGRVAVYNAYTDTLAFVSARNLGQLDFGLYALGVDEFMTLTNDWNAWYDYLPDQETAIANWTSQISPTLNSSIVYRYNLADKAGLDRIESGLYYLEVEANIDSVYPEAETADFYNNRERLILVVSPYNLTLKQSNSDLLAWLIDFQTGLPVADAQVEFYQAQYEEDALFLANAVSDDDGVAFAEYESEDSYEARYAFAFAENEDGIEQIVATTSSYWEDGISRWSFNNVTTEDYQQPYQSHFYTERNIYRPGQMVYFKGIIRADDDAAYSLPSAGRKVALTVYDGQGKEILQDELTLSRMGTINGAIQLDENAGLGFYSYDLVYDDNYFSGGFQVAEYRKPEYIVTVETDEAEYVQGDTVSVTAQADFFAGGAVSNAAVEWTLLSDEYIFRYEGEKRRFDFTDYDYTRRFQDSYDYGVGEVIAEGVGETDRDGRFSFEVSADIADKLSSQRFTLDVVITDLNDQQVASQVSAVVHKGLFYIGLRPERYVGKVDQDNLMNLLVVDWDSQPVAETEVELVLMAHNWYSVQKQYEDGSFYWDSVVEDIPVFTTTITTDEAGEAVAEFVPESGGIYKAVASATDAAGNEVRSSTYLWVSGSRYINWRQENNDRLELVTDKREYNVGDTATILIPHPYSGTVKALITHERGHIYDYQVIDLPTNSEQIEVKITEEMVPNMYLSVVVVQGETDLDVEGLQNLQRLLQPDPARPQGSLETLGDLSLTAEELEAAEIELRKKIFPSFKVGYASLPINNEAKQLNIALTPNKAKQYQPGETVSYNIAVTDAQGDPVEAELSLALVDKAVLSLAPETPGQMLDTFWRNRGLGVRTAGGLTLAMDRVNVEVAPDAKGGGGGIEAGFDDVRGDFRETALWVADLVTDENGEATVEVDLPDNLTTWTLTGKAVTGDDTLVGESTVEIISTKPLRVRPILPRFLTVGDEAQVGLIVQNNSDESQAVEAGLEVLGLPVEPLDDTNIDLAAGERVRLNYLVEVPQDCSDADQLRSKGFSKPFGSNCALTFGIAARSADYEDALILDIPVYRNSTPETVATLGVLSEDGAQAEGIRLPRSFDPTQGELTVNIDGSLAGGMRDSLDYLEHFRYECTEQTVSRFLPNVMTYRAYQLLEVENPELADKLPSLVSTGLQRLYNQQHYDGGWGWWVNLDSHPYISAYVLLSLVEAERAGFAVAEWVLDNAVSYLQGELTSGGQNTPAWEMNRLAFIYYALSEAGHGDLGRAKVLFENRTRLDLFGRAYLAMALHTLDDEADEIDTLLDDITSAAIVSATSAHWEEEQVDYRSMNTDTRSTAIIIAALSRIDPEHPLLPNAVRWLMSVRENGGHWETTQEAAWAIIGLTDWMVASGELSGEYAWQVSLNGAPLGEGEFTSENIDETTTLQAEVSDLLTYDLNRLTVERMPSSHLSSTGRGRNSPGQLYYAAYLNYYKPVEEVKALDRGIIVSRQYSIVGEDEDGTARPVSEAQVGDTIQVQLTVIAPNDLHYVMVEDPLPAGTEGIDTSLATTSLVADGPDLTRTDRRDPWGGRLNAWRFSHTELRDDRAVLFATYLPKGTYQYSYTIRASLPGEFRVRPTVAEQMYFPEVFGRGDGGVFRIAY